MVIYTVSAIMTIILTIICTVNDPTDDTIY